MLIELLKPAKKDLIVSVDLIGERKEDKPRIRISSLGNDLQKQFLDITSKQEDREEIDDRKKRIFDLGNILEATLFNMLDGVVHGIDKIVHTGLLDHRGEEIKGEIDCLYTDEHGITYVVDVKTMSDSSFKKLVEAQDIKKSHYVYYVQLQMYMHFLKLDDSFILAYNKNNSEMAEVFCPYDVDFAREQERRVYKLVRALLGEFDLDLEYPNITYFKTQKVRNKDEYKGLGQIISEPHPMNRYNPYIDTDRKVYDYPEGKDIIYSERQPDASGVELWHLKIR